MMGMLRFRKSSRLLNGKQFAHVYASGTVLRRGPIRINLAENNLGHDRLGLSIPKRAGNAVMRNRIKRLLREAFRSMSDPSSRGHDLVVTVRAHSPLSPDGYRALLMEALRKACR
ncbi:MAG: ribonuclease P protein component [Phycisphaerales bacterium]|nr:ribonuclease P protein component [Phycisphaerales bacterium]